MRRARRVIEWMAVAGYAVILAHGLIRMARHEDLSFAEIFVFCVAAALALLTLIEGRLERRGS